MVVQTDQRKTVEALGLRKLHQTVEHQDNAAIRGMINKVSHLVTVKEHIIIIFMNKEVPTMKFMN